MLIPYQTDAPLYHAPIATAGMIVVNSAVFFAAAMAADHEDIEPWLLWFGRGLHPAQWLTSMFLHFGIFHLLGNMLCLWWFGLVVEGKIGWWRFLLVYLGMGIVEGAIVQTIMRGADVGAAAGASGAIFGLVAISLVWAPRNEMSCMLWIRFRPIFFDISILHLAGIALLVEVVFAFLSGATMSSALLHLLGAAIGLVVGLAMLQLDLVRCEGWDLVSILIGMERGEEEEGSDAGMETDRAIDSEKGPPSPASPDGGEGPPAGADFRQGAIAQIRHIIAEGRPELAYAAHRRMVHRLDGWKLPDAEFLDLIAAYERAGLERESVPVMIEYLRRGRERTCEIRLKLAARLLREEEAPSRALKVLAKIPPAEMNEDQERTCGMLRQEAEALKAAGVIELEGEDV